MSSAYSFDCRSMVAVLPYKNIPQTYSDYLFVQPDTTAISSNTWYYHLGKVTHYKLLVAIESYKAIYYNFYVRYFITIYIKGQ
jgi:hypothetical protein